MAVFGHLQYRAALAEAIERRRARGDFTLRRMAGEVGLQPSFVTNVMKGRLDFSADQLFAVATYLEFREAERAYLLLLLEYERSTHAPRRADLKKQIEDVRREQQKSEKQIAVNVVELTPQEQAQYYLDPFAQIVLVHLNLPTFARHPERLAPALGLSAHHLMEILRLLERIGYIQRVGGGCRVLARDKHLPARNPLSGPAQTLLRFKSLDQLQRLNAEAHFSHTVTLTGDADTLDQLGDAYLAFLKKAEGIVKPAKSERVLQMNFDLFPWEL